jgi:hypothetical protein
MIASFAKSKGTALEIKRATDIDDLSKTFRSLAAARQSQTVEWPAAT